DKNQIVWTNDFNSNRIFRIDMKTGQSTEFFTPSPYEIRDLTVDKTAARPTVWIPAYRPQSRMVKVQVRCLTKRSLISSSRRSCWRRQQLVLRLGEARRLRATRPFSKERCSSWATAAHP